MIDHRAVPVLFLLIVLLSGCARAERSESIPTPDDREATPASTAPAAAATPAAAETFTPIPEPGSSPTAIPERSPTPALAEPAARPVTETDCCGLFSWVGETQLMVFDSPAGAPSGTRIVHVETGDHAFISPGYGLPSPAGVIAFLEPDEDSLMIRDTDGALTSALPTGASAGWPSPDGSAIAWLAPLPIRTPSSSVNRSVQMHVADLETGSARAVLDLQAASINWLPDNRHVIVAARDVNFGSSGIWKIDTHTGQYEILHQELFARAERVSPDGSAVAFMRLFNDDPLKNGLWSLNINSGDLRFVFDSGSYRWDPDSKHVWRLDMSVTGQQSDHLERISIETSEIVERVALEGQILNERWELSPDGRFIAFWRHEDGLVVVQRLR